jgi:DNA-binding LacI/PurR family transcriptional regulator
MTPPRGRSGVPTVTDVAKAAGVTAAVVSRVLNGDETLRVRRDTRERVLAAVKALDYTPNVSARSLRLASSGAICLVVNDIANPIHAVTLQGAQATAEVSRRSVLLADAQEFTRHPERLRSMVDSRRVDGLVMHLAGITGDREMTRVSASRLPTVIINSKVRGPAGSVILDDAAAARLATDHLVDLGHTQIGMISGVAGSDRSERREQGVIEGLEARGLSLRPEWLLDGGFDEPLGHAAGLRLLDRKKRPTAVVVANVMAGIGVLAACKELGIAVPRDLSVIALLDIWFCDHTNPPLTVVDMPMREMGARAVDLLLEMIDGGARQSIVLRDPPPRLIVRESTAPPR